MISKCSCNLLQKLFLALRTFGLRITEVVIICSSSHNKWKRHAGKMAEGYCFQNSISHYNVNRRKSLYKYDWSSNSFLYEHWKMIVSSASRCVAALPAACLEMKDGEREGDKKGSSVFSTARTRATTVSCKCYRSSASAKGTCWIS